MAEGQGTIVVSSVMQDAGFIGTVNRFIGSLSSFASKLSATQVALGTFGITFAAVLIPQLIKTSREMKQFELQTAELIKVLDTPGEGLGTARMISRLSTELPVARKELMEVAAQAARLGIRGARNIEEFVRVSAMIGVATDLSANQAADAFARIMKQTDTTVGEFERMAGVMNALANQMATTDSEIVEATRRSAPDLSRFGLSVDEILTLAASLNEVSESATRAGTRLRMFAQNLTDPGKVQVFADALEMTRKEFRVMAEENPRRTLMQIVEVFREGGVAADRLAAGLNSRVRQVLAALSQNIDGLNKGFGIMEEEGKAAVSSLSKEFSVFAVQTGAMEIQIENMRKEIRRQTLGELASRWSQLTRKIEMFWLGAIAGKESLDQAVGDTSAVDLYEESIRDLDKALFNAGSTGEQMFSNIGVEADRARHMIDEVWQEAIRNAEGAERAFISLAAVMNRVTFPGMGAEEIQDREGDIRRLTSQVDSFWDRVSDRMQEGGPEFAKFANEVFEGILLFAQAGASLDQLMVSLSQGIGLLGKWEPGARSAKDATSEWIEETEDLIQSLREQVAELRGGEIAAVKLTDAWIEASPTQRETIERLLKIKEALKEQKTAQQAAKDAVEEHAKFLEKFNKEARERINERRRAREASRQRISDMEREAAAILRVDDAEQKRFEREQEIIRIWREGNRAGLTREQILDEINAQMAVFAAEDYAAEMNRLNEESKTFGELWAENRDAMIMTEAEAMFDLLTSSIEEMGRASGLVFDALIGKTDDLGDAFVEMIQRVARAAFEQQIMQLLFSGLTDILGQGGGFKVGGGPGAGTPLMDPTGAGAPLLDPVTTGGVPRTTPPSFDFVTTDDLRQTAPRAEHTTIENHYHYDIRALDGPSVREILVRERDTVSSITMDEVNRSRTLKKRMGRG